MAAAGTCRRAAACRTQHCETCPAQCCCLLPAARSLAVCPTCCCPRVGGLTCSCGAPAHPAARWDEAEGAGAGGCRPACLQAPYRLHMCIKRHLPHPAGLRTGPAVQRQRPDVCHFARVHPAQLHCHCSAHGGDRENRGRRRPGPGPPGKLPPAGWRRAAPLLLPCMHGRPTNTKGSAVRLALCSTRHARRCVPPTQLTSAMPRWLQLAPQTRCVRGGRWGCMGAGQRPLTPHGSDAVAPHSSSRLTWCSCAAAPPAPTAAEKRGAVHSQEPRHPFRGLQRQRGAIYHPRP